MNNIYYTISMARKWPVNSKYYKEFTFLPYFLVDIHDGFNIIETYGPFLSRDAAKRYVKNFVDLLNTQ